jgi:uncharacterized protein (DUF2267 family)
MESQKTNDQKASLQSAKETLRKLKDEINLDKPGRVEAQLDALASDLLKSGFSDPMEGAPSLKEVLERSKTKRAVPDDAIDAAEQLAYLIDADWYGDDPSDSEKQKAKEFANDLYETLNPLLELYGQS